MLAQSAEFPVTQGVPTQLSILSENAKVYNEQEIAELLQKASKAFQEYLNIMRKLAALLNAETSTRSYAV